MMIKNCVAEVSSLLGSKHQTCDTIYIYKHYLIPGDIRGDIHIIPKKDNSNAISITLTSHCKSYPFY